MNRETIKKVIYDQHQVIRNAVIVDRDIELEKDVNYVLVGLRRAGKTTLLYKRVQDLINEGIEWDQIIYINFDDERLIDFKVTDFEDILLCAEEMTSKKHYFYFDEIQNIDNWEKFAIRIANQGQKVDITGSNAKMLSKEVEAKLGGRYVSKEVLPYSLREYLRANDAKEITYSIQETGKTNALLEQFFVNGGFPASLAFNNKREYVSSVYQKVLYGDIITHNKIRNENGLKLLVKKLAESVKTDISYTKLQNLISGIGYKISKDVIIDYCHYCEQAFLLFSIENYYAAFVDKGSNKKFYFRDNGILNLFSDDQRTSLLENLVAIHLYRKHKDHLYYLKGNRIDIDFYLSDANAAIQVSYSIQDPNARDREMKNLVEYAKGAASARLIIVTFEEKETIRIGDCVIEVLPLKEFLLD